ncbi:EVE domain-containing protein [bacterium]|nr:EVE domain-containing protein [bacterium]
MPKYWIICISEDNFEISKQHNLIGMSKTKKNDLDEMQVGDIVVFYIAKKTVDSSSSNPDSRVQAFKGIAEITSETISSDELIWKPRGNEIFPHRKQVKFLETDLNVPIRPLIEKLSFVTNTIWWALPLRRGYVEIKESDLELIKGYGHEKNEK